MKKREQPPRSLMRIWEFTRRYVGSAQRLANGNYHFTAGILFNDTALSGRSLEVTPDGKVVYALEITGGLMYRSNRIADLYTPPNRYHRAGLRTGSRGTCRIRVNVIASRQMLTVNAVRSAPTNASGEVAPPSALKNTVPIAATPVANDSC